MAKREAVKTRQGKKRGLGLAVLLWLGLVLGACGAEPTANNTPPQTTPAAQVTPTRTPAPTITSAPTPTSDVARVFDSPAPTPPPIFPTSTPAPTVKGPNFTATAAVPDLNLTPVANVPNGQLAFVQAGNLWLIDSGGGSRKQLTDSGDIPADALIEWTPTADKMVYISQTGELWLVDLEGRRSSIFTPGKTAQLGVPAQLPPLPTQPAGSSGTSKNPLNPAAQPGKTLTDVHWSLDGRFLAFTYYNGEAGPLTSGEVWVAEIIADKAALTRVGEGFSPTWSPDGRTLAFITRGTVRTAPPPTVPSNSSRLTPAGTSLLPPTVVLTKSSEDDRNSILQEQPGTPNPDQPLNGLTPTPTPTSFIIRPGQTIGQPTTPSSGKPTTPGGLGATPAAATIRTTPSPTSNLVALPSATPTPTYPPVFTGTYITNQLATYSVTDHRINALAASDKLPDAFYDLTGTLRSYVPAPFQAAWFSPDGRFVAFSDQLSVVGAVPAGGGNPAIWTGTPQGYAVYDLDWLPRSDGAFVRYGNPYSADVSRLSLITFNNLIAGGISGDVTNPKLVKINEMSGQKVTCPSLSPGGTFFSYYDGNILIVTRGDGSIYQSFADSECPGWSPMGRDIAAVRKTGDRSIVLTSLDQPQPRTIISTRGIDRVFWLR